MTAPEPPRPSSRPDESVSPGAEGAVGGIDVASLVNGLRLVDTNVNALAQSLLRSRQEIESQLSMVTQFGSPAAAGAARRGLGGVREADMRGDAARIRAMSLTEASASSHHARTFLAQRLGSLIAGGDHIFAPGQSVNNRPATAPAAGPTAQPHPQGQGPIPVRVTNLPGGGATGGPGFAEGGLDEPDTTPTGPTASPLPRGLAGRRSSAPAGEREPLFDGGRGTPLEGALPRDREDADYEPEPPIPVPLDEFDRPDPARRTAARPPVLDQDQPLGEPAPPAGVGGDQGGRGAPPEGGRPDGAPEPPEPAQGGAGDGQGGGGGQGGQGGAPAPAGDPGGVGGARASLGDTVARMGSARQGRDAGESLMNAVKQIPLVGAVAGVVDRANSFYRDQMDANLSYQRVIGGQGGGGSERAHRAVYEASNFFGRYGGRRAGEAFDAVTSMGYTGMSPGGEGRQQALDFMKDMYDRNGIDTKESAGYVQQAAQSGAINLQELATQINAVGDAAKDAGVNASAARQSFSDMLGMAVQNNFGRSAPAVAGYMAAQQTSMGKAYQGSMAQQLSTQFTYRFAAQSGISTGAEESLQRNNPLAFAQQQTKLDMNSIASAVGQDSIDFIKQQIQSVGGPQTLVTQPNFQVEIAQRWEDYYNSKGGSLNNLFLQLGPMSGGSWQTTDDMAQWIVSQVAGNTDAKAAADNLASSSVIGSDGKYQGGPKAGQAASATDVKAAGTQAAGLAINAMRGSDSSDSTAAKVQMGREKQGGFHDTLLDTFINAMGSDKNRNAKVLVHTKAGDRVMTPDDAVKNYPNEIATGNIEVVSGEDAGQSVATITGMAVRSDAHSKSLAAAEEAAGGAGTTAGTDAKGWMATHQTGSSGGGTIKIDWANPTIGQILTAYQTDGRSAEAAATAGNAPTVSTNGSRGPSSPTGG